MTKFLIFLGISIGSIVGAYVPVWLWSADALSLWSIFGSIVGSFVGLWAGFRLSRALEP